MSREIKYTRINITDQQNQGVEIQKLMSDSFPNYHNIYVLFVTSQVAEEKHNNRFIHD